MGDWVAIAGLLQVNNQHLAAILAEQRKQTTILGGIMAEVTVDSSVFDNAAAAIESLVAAIQAYLAAHPDIPAADLNVFNQALTDADAAKTELQNATPAPPPIEPPVEPVV